MLRSLVGSEMCIRDRQYLEMAYKDTEYCMQVVLPKDLTMLNQCQSTNQLEELSSSAENKEVKVYFPKFTQRSKVDLTNTLKKLGLQETFSNDANFKYLSTTPLRVDQVVHEAVVIVDEEKTEAAAATAAVMKCAMAAPPKEELIFKADHTFFYSCLLYTSPSPRDS